MRDVKRIRVWTWVAFDFRISSESMVESSKPIWSQLLLIKSAFTSKAKVSLLFCFLIHVSLEDDLVVFAEGALVFMFSACCPLQREIWRPRPVPKLYTLTQMWHAWSSCVVKKTYWHTPERMYVDNNFALLYRLAPARRAFTPRFHTCH